MKIKLIILFLATLILSPASVNENLGKAPILNAAPNKKIEVVRVYGFSDEQIYFSSERACNIFIGFDEKKIDKCVNDLRAIAAVETGGTFNCNLVGDGGDAYGCYQINFSWQRNITPNQAKDIEISTSWVLNKLTVDGYKYDRDYAIMKYNGTPGTKKTIDYLAKVNSWSKKFASN